MPIMAECIILSAFSNTKTNVIIPLGFRGLCLINQDRLHFELLTAVASKALPLLSPLLIGSLQHWHDSNLQEAAEPLSLPHSLP